MFPILASLLELPFEFVLGGEVKLVFRGEDIGFCWESELYEFIAFGMAEQDSDCWVLFFGLNVSVKVVYVHLDLSEVLMGKIPDF